MSLKAITQLKTLLKPLSKDGWPSFVSQLDSVLIIVEIRNCFVAPVLKRKEKSDVQASAVGDSDAGVGTSSPSRAGRGGASQGNAGREENKHDKSASGESGATPNRSVETPIGGKRLMRCARSSSAGHA